MARPTRSPLRALAIVFSAASLLASCSSDRGTLAPEPDLGSTAPITVAPTTTVANRPPDVRAVPLARAEIGERYSDAIVASDPDGDEVIVRLGQGPIGFAPVVNSRGAITGFDWRPTEPGQWSVDVTATDAAGLTTTAEIVLLGRASRPHPLVLAMGDGIAAGFGRDRSDFLGTDDCFRSESDAYAVITTEALVDAGALDTTAEVLVVGCADATLDLLTSEPLHATTGSGDRVDDKRTQMGWASSLNPTIITLTIGGSTGGFSDVDSFFRRDAGNDDVAYLDEAGLAGAQQMVRNDLQRTLEELLQTTDAHVAITTYYNPTAAVPIGIDGCAGACFGEAMEQIVGGLNDAIIGAVRAVSSERISLVRLDGADDVWEASNGLGPDFVRDGLGPFQGVVDRFTGGSSSTCADDGDPPEDLVSALDCVHPNTDGHRRIAERVTEALLSI